ncbi:MAG: hypothetical protein V4564_17235 [Pseudomonadota bacterium]
MKMMIPMSVPARAGIAAPHLLRKIPEIPPSLFRHIRRGSSRGAGLSGFPVIPARILKNSRADPSKLPQLFPQIPAEPSKKHFPAATPAAAGKMLPEQPFFGLPDFARESLVPGATVPHHGDGACGPASVGTGPA